MRNYREEIDEQSAILTAKRDRRQGKLTVIRELAESVAQPQGDSFQDQKESFCSMDQSGFDECDEGVEAGDSRQISLAAYSLK